MFILSLLLVGYPIQVENKEGDVRVEESFDFPIWTKILKVSGIETNRVHFIIKGKGFEIYQNNKKIKGKGGYDVSILMSIIDPSGDGAQESIKKEFKSETLSFFDNDIVIYDSVTAKEKTITTFSKTTLLLSRDKEGETNENEINYIVNGFFFFNTSKNTTETKIEIQEQRIVTTQKKPNNINKKPIGISPDRINENVQNVGSFLKKAIYTFLIIFLVAVLGSIFLCFYCCKKSVELIK